MKGSEHYRRAEALLVQADEQEAAYDWKYSSEGERAHDLAVTASYRQEAQVHATLALAAATAYPAIKDYVGDDLAEPKDWAAVTA